MTRDTGQPRSQGSGSGLRSIQVILCLSPPYHKSSGEPLPLLRPVKQDTIPAHSPQYNAQCLVATQPTVLLINFPTKPCFLSQRTEPSYQLPPLFGKENDSGTSKIGSNVVIARSPERTPCCHSFSDPSLYPNKPELLPARNCCSEWPPSCALCPLTALLIHTLRQPHCPPGGEGEALHPCMTYDPSWKWTACA